MLTVTMPYKQQLDEMVESQWQQATKERAFHSRKCSHTINSYEQ